jgi:hypothetical protein
MYQQRTFKSAGTSGGYRSRYHDFVAQRNPNLLAAGQNKVVRLGQGLINFAIFIALLIGILTLFGFGLSRLNRSERLQNGASPQSKGGSVTSSSGPLTPPTVSPSGQAEVKRKK